MMNNEVQLNFVGDVSLGELFENINHGVKTKILKNNLNPFEFCMNDFAEADLNIVNLECVLSDTSERKKPFSDFLRAPEKLVYLLMNNKIDVVNLANNHSLDHGSVAYENTVKVLNSNGISTFGCNRKKWQEVPLIKDIKGMKIGFLGYYIEETINKELFNKEISWIEKSLYSARPQVDKLVLSLHWGHEYTYYPMSWQVDLAKRLISKYQVDVIYGHHTHRLNGVVRYRNGVIAPSLGNFVFDEHFKKNRLTAILKVYFKKDMAEPKFDFVPFYINSNFQPVPVPPKKENLENLNSILNKLLELDELQKKGFDRKSKHNTYIGHIKNRIKIRFLILLRLENYFPYLKNIFEFSKSKKKKQKH